MEKLKAKQRRLSLASNTNNSAKGQASLEPKEVQDIGPRDDSTHEVETIQDIIDKIDYNLGNHDGRTGNRKREESSQGQQRTSERTLKSEDFRNRSGSNVSNADSLVDDGKKR